MPSFSAARTVVWLEDKSRVRSERFISIDSASAERDASPRSFASTRNASNCVFPLIAWNMAIARISPHRLSVPVPVSFSLSLPAL
eukprot:1657023-Rhodomonas_salina.2